MRPPGASPVPELRRCVFSGPVTRHDPAGGYLVHTPEPWAVWQSIVPARTRSGLFREHRRRARPGRPGAGPGDRRVTKGSGRVRTGAGREACEPGRSSAVPGRRRWPLRFQRRCCRPVRLTPVTTSGIVMTIASAPSCFNSPTAVWNHHLDVATTASLLTSHPAYSDYRHTNSGRPPRCSSRPRSKACEWACSSVKQA